MFSKWKHHGERLRPWLQQLAALVLIGLVFFLGVRSERTGFVREVIDPGFRKLRDPVLNAFRAKPAPVATISIQLDPIAFDSLSRLSEEAIESHVLAVKGSAVFTGQVRIGDIEIPVVLGLREGLAPPGEFRNWPLHVRALPGDTVFRMQSFDVLPIVDDAPLWSILLHAALQEEGNAYLESGIAEVEINGKPLGLCMLQGRPDRTMLARWSRGNGPVLRFDDALMVDARAMMAERIFPSSPPGQGEWLAAPLLLQSAEGDILSGRANKAIKRMEAFRNGQAQASDVFDTDQVARLLATCELLGTRSALEWWKLRFLVDSVSEELVPIPLHIVDHAPIGSLMAEGLSSALRINKNGSEITDRFLADPAIHASYLAYLDTLSVPGWWQGLLQRTQPAWKPARTVVNAEFPRIDLDTLIIAHDRTVIDQALHPKTLVLAYIRDTQAALDGIVVANVHDLPVEVVGVTWNSGETHRFDAPVALAPRERDKPLSYRMIPIPEQKGEKSPQSVTIRLMDTTKEREESIRTWSTFGAN